MAAQREKAGDTHDVESLQCVGVDEAGRGCLAGPVVAAAVMLPCHFDVTRLPCVLTDSKKLTEKQRMLLRPAIMEQAVGFGLGYAWPEEIDRINILQATFLAMSRAALALYRRLEKTEHGSSAALGLPLFIDGNHCIPSCRWEQSSGGRPVPRQFAIVDGDAKNIAISAASILAKTARDMLMQRFAARYPGYGFDGHKGYGTKQHVAALQLFGPCPLHRKTFRKVRKEEEQCVLPVGLPGKHV